MAKIENWAVVLHSKYVNAAPEQMKMKIKGQVWGHPEFLDGDPVLTSELVALDSTRRLALSSNTVYELGEPDPEWIDWLAEAGHEIKDYNFDSRQD